MDENTQLVEMFSEFLTIYKFIDHPKIVEILSTELDDDVKKKIYELSDGNKSTRDIKKIAGISSAPSTITRYWKRWTLKGIVVPTEKRGRYKVAFNLAEYGLSALDNVDEGESE